MLVEIECEKGYELDMDDNYKHIFRSIYPKGLEGLDDCRCDRGCIFRNYLYGDNEIVICDSLEIDRYGDNDG